MKQVWQTIDGKTFTDQLDAAKHEKEMLQGITMWDWDGDHVDECGNAMIVRLIGESAAHAFKQLNANDYDSVPVSDAEITDGEEGIWFWDEYADTYRSITPKVIRALSKVLSEIG